MLMLSSFCMLYLCISRIYENCKRYVEQYISPSTITNLVDVQLVFVLEFSTTASFCLSN